MRGGTDQTLVASIRKSNRYINRYLKVSEKLFVFVTLLTDDRSLFEKSTKGFPALWDVFETQDEAANVSGSDLVIATLLAIIVYDQGTTIATCPN